VEKAFAYLRVSSQNQIDGDGYERQRDAIVRYCKVNALTVVGWYREQETGTVQERPELARLMVDLESNGHGIKTVIIERLDRLARDLMVQEAIIQDLRRHRIELISAAEGPDLASGDPPRKLIRQVLGAVAEYDKTMLVLKLRAARQRKRIKTGKCEGAKRYGEDSEEEQAIIRKIRAMRRNKRGGRKGATLQEIADRLNAEGIPTKRGKNWAPAQVYYILRYRKAKVKGRIQKSVRIKVGS
jgi:DNA invertase Pin-like site-specific DNA recombinase